MHKQVRLIDNFYIPKELEDSTTMNKYVYLNELYKSGKHHILLNNISVFGPYPRPEVPWDISEVQKIATYNPEVTSVLTWINTNIVIKLCDMTYKTKDVLVRIATGMLNKCNIPKEVQIMFHDNMVNNLDVELDEIIQSDLPF